MDVVHLMRDTLPPEAGTLSEPGGPRDPKQDGGRPLPRRCTGGGDVGGEKNSSLELDATAALGVVPGGCEAGLSDESGGGVCAFRALDRVSILHY